MLIFQNSHVSYFQLACYVDRKCFLKNTKKQRNVFSLMAKRKMDSHWKLTTERKGTKAIFVRLQMIIKEEGRRTRREKLDLRAAQWLEEDFTQRDRRCPGCPGRLYIYNHRPLTGASVLLEVCVCWSG